MRIVGLVLVIAWVVIVSVVPAVVRARAGDAVPSLHQDAQGSPGWWARVLGFVGFVLAVAAPLAARAGLPPLEPLDRLAVQLVGIALVVVGIPAILGAQFAIVRNPVLSCMFIVPVGLALINPNVVSLAMLIAVAASVQVQVRLVEEPYLLCVHGDAYRAYAARTGRFVPGVGRLRG
jgi:protein-S-isoprenylcysteine O-methyltransferase Ste14